ncbi:RNA polymerase II-associated protein [Hymenopellis radicata]|nr:RNA polymerase II-associated protein [Hymenopellis radicata]
MSSPDAALTLRQAIKGKQIITYAINDQPCSSLSTATHVVIPPHSFPKSTATRFRKLDVTTPTGPNDFYSLEALYLAWHLKDASAAEYTRQARENGVGVGLLVSVTARKRVLEWLEGDIDDGDLIVSLPGERILDTTWTPTRTTSSLPVTTSPKKSVPDTPSSKRRYVPDPHDMEVVKKIKRSEIELRDRNAVLQGTKPNNFTNIKNVYTEKLKKMREANKAGAPPTAATASTPDHKMQARKARSNFPIIMVSSSPTALITMHNVKRFLQEAVFETSQEAREKGNTEKLVTVDRKLTHIDPGGKERSTQARYIVVDSHESLNRFGPDAWERVVCVMTTAKPGIKGIYFSWASDPPNAKIKDWNVSELKIDQNRRHVDKAVVASFWKALDTWMMANKPGLMPNDMMVHGFSIERDGLIIA